MAMASATRLPVFDGLRATSSPSSSRVKPAATQLGFGLGKRLRILAFKKVVKARQVILEQDVQFLGKAGELVTVKAGYFRNFLYPKAMAKLATPEYLKELKLTAQREEAEKLKVKEDAEAFARELQSIGVFNVKRKRGMARLIFGSVTSQDLADIIEYRTKKKVDKRNLSVPEIRQIGTYTAELKLHPEVSTQIKINVIGT